MDTLSLRTNKCFVRCCISRPSPSTRRRSQMPRSGSRALIGSSAKIDQAAVGTDFRHFHDHVQKNSEGLILLYAFNSTLFHLPVMRSYSFTSTINQSHKSADLKGLTVPVPPMVNGSRSPLFLDQETAKIVRARGEGPRRHEAPQGASRRSHLRRRDGQDRRPGPRVTRGSRPSVIALAGPMGAGKSTVGRVSCAAPFGSRRSSTRMSLRRAFRPSTRTPWPSRLAESCEPGSASRPFGGASSAFETTLAGRTHAPWLRMLIRTGYAFRPASLRLPSPSWRSSASGHGSSSAAIPFPSRLSGGGTLLDRELLHGIQAHGHDSASLRQPPGQSGFAYRRRPPRRAALGAGPGNLGSSRGGGSR